MKNEIKKEKTFEYVVITYNDGYVKFYDAVYIKDNEIALGKISDDNIFIKYGGIPKENIKKIVAIDKEGKSKNIAVSASCGI